MHRSTAFFGRMSLSLAGALALAVLFGSCQDPLFPPGAVTGVTVTPAELELAVGQTSQLSARIAPSDATNKVVSWESSSECATVSESGLVTAVSPGEATVTATTMDGSFTSSCVVTVREPTIAVTGIVLDAETLSLVVGASAYLSATVSPDNASDKSVSWSVSGSAASVSEDGEVTALAVGTARVTASAGNGAFTASCDVTVTPIRVTGIEVNKTALSLPLNRSERLLATLSPANATDQGIIWTSSSSNASVSSDGTVTALALGTATITAESADGGFRSSCAVTVIPVPVSGVSLNKASLSLQAGHSEVLLAEVHPDDAANKAVTWSSSNIAIAQVYDGQVFALEAGSATITVTADDGGYTAQCVVTVTGALSHTYAEVLPAANAMQNGLLAAVGSNDPSSTAYAVLTLSPSPKLTCYLNGYQYSGYTLTGSVAVSLNPDYTQGPMNGTVNLTGGIVSSITYVNAVMTAPYSGTLLVGFSDGTSGTVDLATGTYTDD